MITYKLTAADFDADRNYIGTLDVADCDGNIEIPADLGRVRFPALKAAGFIVARAGSGISAGEGISAGWGISAGEGISAGSGISAGWGISAGSGYGIYAGTATFRQVRYRVATVTCASLDRGEIVCGELVIVDPGPKTVVVDGVTYELSEDLATALAAAVKVEG